MLDKVGGNRYLLILPLIDSRTTAAVPHGGARPRAGLPRIQSPLWVLESAAMPSHSHLKASIAPKAFRDRALKSGLQLELLRGVGRQVKSRLYNLSTRPHTAI